MNHERWYKSILECKSIETAQATARDALAQIVEIKKNNIGPLQLKYLNCEFPVLTEPCVIKPNRPPIEQKITCYNCNQRLLIKVYRKTEDSSIEIDSELGYKETKQRKYERLNATHRIGVAGTTDIFVFHDQAERHEARMGIAIMGP